MTILALETLFVMPIALGYLVIKHTEGLGSMGTVPLITALLVFSGVVTSIPLLWFAQGAARVPLSTMGILQYFSPSIMLVLGVFIYREEFTPAHIICFIFIWSALVLYGLSNTKILPALKPSPFWRKRYRSQ